MDVWQLCVALLPVIVPGARGGPACWSQHVTLAKLFSFQREMKSERDTLPPLCSLGEPLCFLFPFPSAFSSLQKLSLLQSQYLQAQKWPCFSQPQGCPSRAKVKSHLLQEASVDCQAALVLLKLQTTYCLECMLWALTLLSLTIFF